ncbi:hypothetical protein EDD11_000752 [Mortierella claussenii]|nr:hypothetical protein EDD11_000752 [Mortierella claussenii]
MERYELPRVFFLAVDGPFKCEYSSYKDSTTFLKAYDRHLAAKRNPDPFKNVTRNLDGHDSRIIYVNADKASLYSYKLMKSGFRVQVCTDMNMVLFVSAPAPCHDYNDGTVLLRMGI